LLRTADEVRKQVAEAYHLVLGAVEGKGILENALALVKESFAETQQLKAEGFVNQVAVDQLELAVQELELELATAGKQVGLTMSLLRFQMGIHPTIELLLTQSLADLMSENNGLELLSQPFNSSLLPGLEEQRTYVELAGLNVKNQQAMGWPEISAFYTNQGNAQRDAFNFLQSDGNWYPVQLWGINFSMPLWTSFSGRHQVEQKKIKEERAKLGLEQMEHAAMMEFDHARTNLVQAMGAFQNRTRAVELAQRIYDQTQLAFKEGVVSSFEWTQSRNQLIEAQGNLLGASLDWLNAQVRLQAALSKFE
ncbi:MAG: TolC family protein, partial [Flavobacteriales bacterium]|nr:TolC family protein [Flavobacteriales bacterium]